MSQNYWFLCINYILYLFLSNFCVWLYFLPSVLWHYWLGIMKGIRPVKTELWGVGVSRYLSGAMCKLYPRTPSSLASFKSRLGIPFWYWLTQVVPEKRCSSSSIFIDCSAVSQFYWGYFHFHISIFACSAIKLNQWHIYLWHTCTFLLFLTPVFCPSFGYLDTSVLDTFYCQCCLVR